MKTLKNILHNCIVHPFLPLADFLYDTLGWNVITFSIDYAHEITASWLEDRKSQQKKDVSTNYVD